jgi:hypothetical protein
MNFQGRVIKRSTAAGSKSEREAVVLSTSSGEYVLRRQGGNAFHDPELEGLIGQTISADGDLHGYTLIMHSWTPI